MTDEIIEEEMEEEELEIDLRKRVRLFNLSEDGSKWCERGIGQVSACYFEKLNETFLLVNAETDGSLLLEIKIQQDTAYMKQQGRFIIWTEDEQILGLSFQENAGCNDVWEMICQVQGKDPNSEIVPDTIKKEEEIKKEIKEEIKEEPQEENIVEEPKNVAVAENVAQEMWFEEMLDIEHAELSTYEIDVLEQLIDLVNRLVSPAPEDKFPPPEESQLLELYRISEDMEENEGFQQLHETIMYLLSLKRERQ